MKSLCFGSLDAIEGGASEYGRLEIGGAYAQHFGLVGGIFSARPATTADLGIGQSGMVFESELSQAMNWGADGQATVERPLSDLGMEVGRFDLPGIGQWPGADQPGVEFVSDVLDSSGEPL